MLDELTYPFPDFNGATVDVWEWKSNFTPPFTEHVITYPCWDWSQTMLGKGGPEENRLFYLCFTENIYGFWMYQASWMRG